MQAPDIRDSEDVTRLSPFRLQRVTVASGERYLVKSAHTPGEREDRLVRREFALLSSLASERIARPVWLGVVGGSLRAFYSDVSGHALADLQGPRGLSSEHHAAVVRELCAVLDIVGDAGMLALALSPASFLWSDGGRLVLVDAPFLTPAEAVVARTESDWIDSPYLPYVAPEVLRASTPRGAPQAADLYTLGALLYELLSGRPPFETSDPGELIHAHMAREPVPLEQLAPALPPSLARSVMRLLAKNPEQRFLSTGEFLEACELSWPTEAAVMDKRKHGRPRWTNAFYGRRNTLRVLREILEESDEPSIVFVRGDPGSGKTSLLRELSRSAGSALSYTGKFTHGGNAQPLSGWGALARQLAEHALSARERDFASLRPRLQHELGASGPVLVSLAEEWAAVLHCEGHGDDQPEGGLNRTAIALQRALSILAGSGAPVWVILEDLQWADESSLRILELVLSVPGFDGVRFVASMRSPDHDGQHADLEHLEQNLRRNGTAVHTLELSGWDLTALSEFIRDGFADALERPDELMRMVLDKTGGNPFFVREYLDALVESGALALAQGRWRWTAEGCSRVALPASLLDLLMLRMQQLSDETKQLLACAASLGDRTTGALLARASSSSIERVAVTLASAVDAGLLVAGDALRSPELGEVAFAHDRVHDAALALLASPARAEMCLSMFRLLSAPEAAADNVPSYTLAGLFNAGSAGVQRHEELLAGVEVNHEAGVSAMRKGAFTQAHHHLTHALEILVRTGSAFGRDHHALSRRVYERAAEAALLCNMFERTEVLCGELISNTEEPVRKAVAYELLVRALIGRKQFGAGLDAALRILAELGVSFPSKPTMAHVIAGFAINRLRLTRLGFEGVVRLPARSDERIGAVTRILQTTYSAANFNRPLLFPLIAYKQFEHCMRYGLDECSGMVLQGFAMVLAGLGQVAPARRLAAASFELPRTPESEKLQCRVLFAHHSFVQPWYEPARKTHDALLSSVQVALTHGDFEYAGYCMGMRTLGRVYCGAPLAELSSECESIAAQLTSFAQERTLLMMQIVQQVVHTLREGSSRGEPLCGPYYEAELGLRRCLDPVDNTLVFNHYMAQLFAAAHFNDPSFARRVLEESAPYVAKGTFATYLYAPFLFYEAWACAVQGEQEPRTGRAVRRRLAGIVERLAGWEKHESSNFRSKRLYAEAELWRSKGQLDRAASCYELAIDEARRQEYLHEAALMHERAAGLWLARGAERLGRQHLLDAHAITVRWGATAALKRLEGDHRREFALLGAQGSASEVGPHQLDYRALIRSSQAISGEILLPKLLERLLAAIMEHTTAQRGVLLLERRGQLVVQAEADVDRPFVELVDDETVDSTERLCPSIAHYVARLERAVVLDEAERDDTFGRDSYVMGRRPRSVLCAPILYQKKLLGLIYLENNRVSHVFTRARLEMVGLLAGQAAISIANARFHAVQLEAQQARISPHFLFNALSSIAELALVDGFKAESAIVKLAHLYRYILASSTTELVSLEQELSIVRDYLKLEKLRFGDQLQFSVTDEGPVGQFRLPGLLIQPLVENSIRHAIAPRMAQGNIWVHARVTHHSCSIVVQDDGDGSKHATFGTGYGLRSVQQRLELVYGERYSFAISQRGGYRVEIELPRAAREQAASPALHA